MNEKTIIIATVKNIKARLTEDQVKKKQQK